MPAPLPLPPALLAAFATLSPEQRTMLDEYTKLRKDQEDQLARLMALEAALTAAPPVPAKEVTAPKPAPQPPSPASLTSMDAFEAAQVTSAMNEIASIMINRRSPMTIRGLRTQLGLSKAVMQAALVRLCEKKTVSRDTEFVYPEFSPHTLNSAGEKRRTGRITGNTYGRTPSDFNAVEGKKRVLAFLKIGKEYLFNDIKTGAKVPHTWLRNHMGDLRRKGVVTKRPSGATTSSKDQFYFKRVK